MGPVHIKCPLNRFANNQTNPPVYFPIVNHMQFVSSANPRRRRRQIQRIRAAAARVRHDCQGCKLYEEHKSTDITHIMNHLHIRVLCRCIVNVLHENY